MKLSTKEMSLIRKGRFVTVDTRFNTYNKKLMYSSSSEGYYVYVNGVLKHRSFDKNTALNFLQNPTSCTDSSV